MKIDLNCINFKIPIKYTLITKFNSINYIVLNIAVNRNSYIYVKFT